MLDFGNAAVKKEQNNENVVCTLRYVRTVRLHFYFLPFSKQVFFREVR